jgi:hypothetical protein
MSVALPSLVRPYRLLARRGLIVAIGCCSLAWAVIVLPRSEAADEFRDLENQLLQFTSFSSTSVASALKSGAVGALSPCDTHGQHALLLLEIPLSDVALRSGAVREFDRRNESLESRARQILSCAPRDSFAWLILFGAGIQHGRLDAQTFDLLAMSYETSPNEAWIAIRRSVLAAPVVLSAPQPIQDKILAEFRALIRDGFVEMPAQAYLRASVAVRALLQSQVEKLDERAQKRFSDALQKLGA